MTPLPFYVGISGHRELENPEQVRADILAFLKDEKKKHANLVGISALAEGADSIFAEVILDLGFPLEVLLPFQQAEYEKDFAQNPDALKVFRETLSKAHRVDENLRITGSTSEERNEAYLACGKGIVDKSGKMIFVYNGEKSNGTGGTGDIIVYCKGAKKDFTDIRAYQNTLQRVKHERDDEANIAQVGHKKLWRSTLRLGLIAALTISLTQSFTFPQVYNFLIEEVGMLCIIRGIWLYYYIEKGKLKGDRITARRDAELLRIVETFIKGGIKLWPLNSVRLSKKYISDPVRELIEDAEQNTHSSKSLNKQKHEIHEIVDDQLKYHSERVLTIKRKLPLYEHAQWMLLILFGFVSLLLFGMSFYETFVQQHLAYVMELTRNICIFLVLLIPPILAAIEAYIYFNELRKNMNDSEFMNQYLTHWKEQLVAVVSPDGLEKLANEIRQKMDDENINWAISTDANANGKF